MAQVPRNKTGGNVSDDYKDLFDAVSKNNVDGVKSILSRARDQLNEVSSVGTPLHLAVGRGNLSMVEYLISQPDLDIFQKDRHGQDALDLAISVGHPGVRSLLFRTVSDRLGLSGKSSPDRSGGP